MNTVPTSEEVSKILLPIWLEKVKLEIYNDIFEDVKECDSLDDEIYEKRIKEFKT